MTHARGSVLRRRGGLRNLRFLNPPKNPEDFWKILKKSDLSIDKICTWEPDFGVPAENEIPEFVSGPLFEAGFGRFSARRIR